MLVDEFEIAWVIVDADEKLLFLVEGNRNGEVLAVFTVEFSTPTSLVKVAIMLVEKIETVCVWLIVCEEEL